jgi:hypothetical protein
MNRRLIAVLALLIAAVGVVGIWMPQIREWRRARASRQERERYKEWVAFEDMWLTRESTFFEVRRSAEETDRWYKQAKKEFCSDPSRQKYSGGSAKILEITILGNAPKTEDASCDDAVSYSPR